MRWLRLMAAGACLTVLATAPPAVAAKGGWTGLRQCADPALAAYQCGELTVRVGHRDVDLPVLVAGNPDADQTMLLLTGGPGQPGPVLAPRVLRAFEDVLGTHRIVFLDQRGTGANALDCPQLQAERGGSDLGVPSRAAVLACAETLGSDRDDYASSATVGDLEALRRALGVQRWAVNGVSYGSYVAQRYAVAHPRRVTHLVLDSVVPAESFDATQVDTYAEHARVLRDVCASRSCPGDPAADLAAVLAAKPELGPTMLELVTNVSYVNPAGFMYLPEALHAAAGGDFQRLTELTALVKGFFTAPADEYSQGIQAATLCQDLTFPWPGAQTPGRVKDLLADHRIRRLSPADLWPYNAQAARDNGQMVMCEHWPQVRDTEVPRGYPRGVRTLLIAGERDLGTPLAWAQRAHRAIPGSVLKVVPDGPHSSQVGNAPGVRSAVAEFLRS